VPVFEIRDTGGEGDRLLVRNPSSAQLSQTLGTAPVALMRGHGDVVVRPIGQGGCFPRDLHEVNARLESEGYGSDKGSSCSSTRRGRQAAETK